MDPDRTKIGAQGRVALQALAQFAAAVEVQGVFVVEEFEVLGLDLAAGPGQRHVHAMYRRVSRSVRRCPFAAVAVQFA